MSRKLLVDLVKEIPKEVILKYYITENMSYVECAEHFNITTSMFMKLLKYYEIKKPRELHTAQIKQTKLRHFGDPNYNNHAKTTQTNLAKYGVENQFQRKDLFPAIYSKKIEKYGTYNNIEKNFETRIKNSGSIQASYEKQKQTYKKTCMEKYGVENAAQTAETKEKIKQTVTETFLATYGVKNYWELPTAKRSNGSKNSMPNSNFAKLLTDNEINFEQEFYLAGRWYDFKIDDYLVEINPTCTHNINWGPFNAEQGIEKNYHKNKTDLANINNYKCIHVFDWDDPNKIIKILKKNKLKIGARECVVEEVSIIDAANFLNDNHIQGYAKDKIRIALKYQDKIVALLTFGTPRYNKNYEYELIRYCVSDYQIAGGFNKMLHYFIETYAPMNIISYCDSSKFDGKIYESSNFKKIYRAAPSCHWYNCKTGRHITDNLLRQRGYDQLFNTNYGKFTSNTELMLNNGFVQVYDCGQITYALDLSKPLS